MFFLFVMLDGGQWRVMQVAMVAVMLAPVSNKVRHTSRDMSELSLEKKKLTTKKKCRPVILKMF